MAKEADSLDRVLKKMVAGTWVPICRRNAETLMKRGPPFEVHFMKRFRGEWTPLVPYYEYTPGMKFRARNREPVND